MMKVRFSGAKVALIATAGLSKGIARQAVFPPMVRAIAEVLEGASELLMLYLIQPPERLAPSFKKTPAETEAASS